MRRLVTSTLLTLGLIGAASAQPALAQDKSLYQRLGGYDAIAVVTDDFLGRLVGDAQFARFFAGHSTDSKMRIRQHIVEQLCAAAGGPCVYRGRDMKTAHAGLGITESQWDLSVRLLVASLDKFKVPEREKSDLLGAIGPLKSDIVEVRQ